MPGMIWYLEGDENVRSIVSKRFTDSEVSLVDITDEGGTIRKLYKMEQPVLDKILDEIAFINRRLAYEHQIEFDVYYENGPNSVERWMNIPVVPSPMPDFRLAS